jgi:hypothetical protein
MGPHAVAVSLSAIVEEKKNRLSALAALHLHNPLLEPDNMISPRQIG